jgi:putative heme transporter
VDDRSPLDRAASFSWKYLLIIAAVAVTFYAVAVVKVVIIPMILAFFLAAVLSPITQWFKARGWSPMASTWVTIALVVPFFVGLVLLLVPSFAEGLGPLADDVTAAVDEFVEWLSTGPLQLSETDIQEYIEDALEALRDNLGGITSGILGGASVALEVVAGTVFTFLATFFYLKDGDRAYAALLRRIPNPDRAHDSMWAAWKTLSAYVRGLAIVGFVDALFIGIGLTLVGAPLVLPLSVLVFFGGFFPIVGAFLSGLLAVSVTFVNSGLTDALIVLAIVVAVQQVEGNVLHPIVFRRALSLHPLVILLSLTIGGVAFGIVGAFLAVPLTAMVIAWHKATVDDPDRSVVALLRSPIYDDGDPLDGNAIPDEAVPTEE